MSIPHRRILLGLIVMIAIQIGGHFLPGVADDRIGQVLAQSAIVEFVAAFAGGWVARGRFVLPAMAFWLVIWTAVLGSYYVAAAPTGLTIVPLAEFAWVSIAVSGVAIAGGAFLGQRLKRQ